MEDANTLLANLAAKHPYLAPGIAAANARALEQEIVRKENEVKLMGLAVQTPDYDAPKPVLPKYNDGRPEEDYNIQPNFPKLKSDMALGVWVDQYSVKAQINIPFMGMKYYMDFGGLEKPALDRLFLARTTGQDYAFCTIVDQMFTDAARAEEAIARENKKFHGQDRFRFQASVVSKSQYDTSEILSTNFARLYYNDIGQMDYILLLDGMTEYKFKLTPHRGNTTSFNSPSFQGILV